MCARTNTNAFRRAVLAGDLPARAALGVAIGIRSKIHYVKQPAAYGFVECSCAVRLAFGSERFHIKVHCHFVGRGNDGCSKGDRRAHNQNCQRKLHFSVCHNTAVAAGTFKWQNEQLNGGTAIDHARAAPSPKTPVIKRHTCTPRKKVDADVAIYDFPKHEKGNACEVERLKPLKRTWSVGE